MTGRLSIPTRYGAQRFRSKLEADWARALDAMGIPWEYEREGTYFGDVFYLPDFWLPRSRQFLEVKATMDPAGARKTFALLEYHPWDHVLNGLNDFCADFRIVIGWPGGCFAPLGAIHKCARSTNPEVTAGQFFIGRRRDFVAAYDGSLFRCDRCDGWWFGDQCRSFQCRCCGAGDGDRFIKATVGSPLPSWRGGPRRVVAGSIGEGILR